MRIQPLTLKIKGSSTASQLDEYKIRSNEQKELTKIEEALVLLYIVYAGEVSTE